MKTRLLFIIVFFFITFSNVYSQCESVPSGKTCVPDNRFETYLESIGKGDDIEDNDLVFTSRIETLVDLNVSNQGIKSMDGIENFTALETLNCSSNNLLASLNVFNNTALKEIRAYNCNIMSLTLPNNNLLAYLNIGNNNLASLDLSEYPMLEYLACYNNGPQDLGDLNLSANVNLTDLIVHNAGISSLNISTCTNLEVLTCYSSYNTSYVNNIPNLDLSANTSLSEVRCYNSGVNNLSFSTIDYNSLLYLDCGDNNISSLDTTKFPNIETLWLYYNNLSGLNLTNNTSLKSLDCGGNPSLNSIDLSMLPNLEKFWGYDNNFTGINASANMKLALFNSNSNSNLTSINLPETTTLEEVYVCCSNLSNLDFVSNTGIKYLDIGINTFTSADVSMLPNLIGFWCNQNQLTELNIANGNIDGLDQMWAHDNPMLNCIQVDDLAKASAKSSPEWQRDAGADFSLNCSLSTNEFNVSSILIYPNPTTSTINIRLEFDAKYNIVNVLGKVIMNGKLNLGKNQINLPIEIPNGIYYLKVEGTKVGFLKKIIKY